MRQATKVIKGLKVPARVQADVCNTRFTAKKTLQERELAFFFLDIRNFTPFIASRPAPEAMHLLQQAFKIFRQAITSRSGTIIETAGDGLYAVFGLKEPLSDATPSAVEAGFSIIHHLDWANQTYFDPFYHHCFQVSIGLHVGEGIIGKLGLGVKNHLTIMGYPVNLAARLQQATKRLNNSFVISAESYRLLPQPPKALHKRITLKGIPRAKDVYLLGCPYSLIACRDNKVWKVAC